MRKYFLTDTYTKFNHETEWLLLEFDRALNDLVASGSSDRFARLSAEMAVVRLHDAWARFSREIIILSAGARPYTASGIRLSTAPGIVQIPDVIPALFNTYSRPRRFEPRWARPSESIDAARRLNIQNFSTVAAAFGATNLPAEEMRPIRNFFAHRGKDTANEVRMQSFFAPRDKVNVESVAGKLVPPGITIFESWVINLRLVATASIQ
jgi:hypothetical protein